VSDNQRTLFLAFSLEKRKGMEKIRERKNTLSCHPYDPGFAEARSGDAGDAEEIKNF